MCDNFILVEIIKEKKEKINQYRPGDVSKITYVFKKFTCIIKIKK